MEPCFRTSIVLSTAIFNPRPLGHWAERAPPGADTAPLPNLRTSGLSEAGKAAIESFQLILFSKSKKNLKITNQIKVRLKLKITSFRLIAYKDVTDNNFDPKLRLPVTPIREKLSFFTDMVFH